MSSSPTSSSSSEPAAAATAPFELASLGDVVCQLDFVIGTANMAVADCLRLQLDSVVRLAQSAGSDLELRAHGVVVGHGEVAVVDDIASLRMTRIAVPAGVGWE